MRLFFVIIYSFTTFCTITCTSNPELKLVVNPAGYMYGSGPPILVRKVDDSLNLTCKLVNHKHETLPNYNLSWNWQYSMGSNANRVMVVSLSHNEANLVFDSLKETDSGEYTCKCTELDLYENVRVKVKAFKKYCSEKMFVCSNGHCIGRHFVCDGKPDCKFGIDEAYENCGPNPCEGKIPCENGRCIPMSWCCDEYHDPNCTTKVKPSCCQQLTTRIYDSYPEPQYSDMGFLQTTIYTVIGCAMAFMFIVTILVIAICRVHLKRTVISRCPLSHQHLRPGSPMRPGLPLYDIDMFLDRHQDSHAGGLLVTYNINNGVQFVGRPVDPPPYCEVVDTPPREGPPPPYVSRENLTENNSTENSEPSLENATSDANRNQGSNELNGKVTSDDEPDTDLESTTQSEFRVTHVPPDVISNLKGLTTKKKYCESIADDAGLASLFEDYEVNSENEENNHEELVRNPCVSSLGDVSKFKKESATCQYDICSSVPSVSGLSKIRNKNIKRNVFTDFSDSESDSSCMENDALLNGSSDCKKSRNMLAEMAKRRSSSLSNAHENANSSSSNSFINNIAAVSKSLIGSLSKKQTLETDVKHNKNDKFVRGVSPNIANRKPFKPLLTQKSFDSSDRCRKEIVTNESSSNFDKIVPSVTHSMGDLSPVSSDLNYRDFERQDYLTLPLRESFIGVRNEEL